MAVRIGLLNTWISDTLPFLYLCSFPVLKYVCPVWHDRLTNERCHQIESIQARALKIIFSQNYTFYNETCSNLKLSSLSDCRMELCKAFFGKSVLDHKNNVYTICYFIPD